MLRLVAALLGALCLFGQTDSEILQVVFPSIPAEQIEEQVAFLERAGNGEARDKLDASLRELLSHSADSAERVNVTVLARNLSAVDEIGERLIALGGETRVMGLWIVSGAVPINRVIELASGENVAGVSRMLGLSRERAQQINRAVEERAQIEDQNLVARWLWRFVLMRVALRLVSQGWAELMESKFRGWRTALPACPNPAPQATDDRATDCHGVEWIRSDHGLGLFHPGAAYSYRSAEATVRTYQFSVLGEPLRFTIRHGQQCCYREDGSLITSGHGAGTPDFWTPGAPAADEPGTWVDAASHFLFDVLPWFGLLDDQLYKRYWVPDVGAPCGPRNAPPGGEPPARRPEWAPKTRDLIR